MKALLLAVLLLPASLHASPYRLDLELDPAAPFPAAVVAFWLRMEGPEKR